MVAKFMQELKRLKSNQILHIPCKSGGVVKIAKIKKILTIFYFKNEKSIYPIYKTKTDLKELKYVLKNAV